MTIGVVEIFTGDYLLADQDGVVVISRSRVAEVVQAAEDAAGVENKVRTAILGGADPEQAYLKYGKF